MKVTLTASTGAIIVVWHDHDLYHARRAESAGQPEVCLGVDLFEVVAELAGLNLDRVDQAHEATQLADEARRRLADAPGALAPDPEALDDSEVDQTACREA